MSMAEDWKACQSECKQLPHCSIFTFKADTWPKGGCWLMPALKYTQAVNDTQAVSGPQDCEARSAKSRENREGSKLTQCPGLAICGPI